jgi:MFS family permease
MPVSYHMDGIAIWRLPVAPGQHVRHMVAIRSRLPRSILVLRHHDFALVQLGNGVSQLGTWGQYVALAWAIRELSSWPFAVALSLVAQFLPFLVLSPIGGALADRIPRRRIVVIGNILAVPPSIALGVLVATGEQTIPLLLALAFAGGVATAISQPAMSAVVGEIVPEDELPEAVASVSIIVNLTRILGPSLGALVISGWGLQWTFYLNAVSFLAVVVSWAFVRTQTRPHETHEPFRRQLLLGLRFARADRQIGFLLLITFVTTFVVYHAALMPVIVTDLLHEGSTGFAIIQTTTGFGAIVGAIVAGEFLSDRRRRIAIGASIAFVATMYAVISTSRQLWITALALAGFGFAFFVLSTTVQGLLIAGSPDEFRGRVMGIYTMLTAGGVPIAALIGGVIGSVLGPGEAVGFASVVMFGLVAWIIVTHRLRVVSLEVHTEPLKDPSLIPPAEIDPVL